MPVFKFVIGDGKKSYQVEKDQADAPIIGKKIGDVISGSFLGLEGYELQIKGGTDKDGFPMYKNVEGQVKRKIILTKGPVFHTEKEGMRKRKLVRGNSISHEITQINCKVSKRGDKDIETLLGIKKEDQAETAEGQKEEPKSDA